MYHVMNRGDQREDIFRDDMGGWTYVSNLLNEPPETHPQAQEVLPPCQ